jgi:adenine phosphoribosyltransferase
MNNLQNFIRNVQDFPKPGIGFKDITTLLKEPVAFRAAIDSIASEYASVKIDKIVGTESRGFIFGAPLAYNLHAGFVPVRKPGKLPAETESAEYELEYGTDKVEIHKDAITKGERVLIVDDLLATGGTAAATAELVEKLGGEIIGIAFLIELSFLNGRRRLGGYHVSSIIQYKGE